MGDVKSCCNCIYCELDAGIYYDSKTIDDFIAYCELQRDEFDYEKGYCECYD